MAKPRYYIRVAKNIYSDPKLQSLSEGERWAWICLLSLADDSSVPGTLTESPEEMAYRLRLQPDTVRGCIEKLMGCPRPPIVQNNDGVYTIVNFRDHQGARFPSDEPEAVRDRVRKSRSSKSERESSESSNSDVTNVTNETSGDSVTTCNTTHDIPSHDMTSQKTPSQISLRDDSNVDARGFDEIDIEFPETHNLAALKAVVKSPAAARWASAMCPGLDWKADTSDCFRYIQANPKKAISDLTRYWQDWLRRKQREHERDVMKAAALAREESSHDKPVTIPERGLWVLPLAVAPPRPEGFPSDVVPVSRDGFVQWFFPDKIPPGAQDLGQYLQHGQSLAAC